MDNKFFIWETMNIIGYMVHIYHLIHINVHFKYVKQYD